MNSKKVLFATESPHPDFSVLRGLFHREGTAEIDLADLIVLSPHASEEWGQALSGLGIPNPRLNKSKFSPSTILAAAEKEQVFLILIYYELDWEAPPRYSPMKSLLKKTNVPVMIVPADEKHSRSPDENIFTHVVFATDWSQTSENAFNFLLHFQPIIKELEIVNVIKDRLTIRTLRQLRLQLEKKRRICLDKHCLDAEFHVYAGNTDDEILKCAHDYHATLITLGAKRKEGLKEVFRKRAGWRVAKKSHLPVLIVPTGAN